MGSTETGRDLAELSRLLAGAAESHNRQEAGKLVDKLVTHLRRLDEPDSDTRAVGEAEATRILKSLRGQRWFQLVEQAADGFVQSGYHSPAVRRLLIQAFIDQGTMATALALVEQLIAETADGSEEHATAWGLRGRIFKQLYMDGGTSASAQSHRQLQEAIDSYGSVYRKDAGKVWHGINAVALIDRARRDGVDVTSPDAKTMAEAILAKVELRNLDRKAEAWDFATAAEACIFFGREDEALRWIDKYARGEYTDAFALAGTMRQLQEVWQLTPDDPPGNHILPLLQAAMLRSEGGEIDHATGSSFQGLHELAQDPRFEAILGTEAFKEVQWLKTAMDRAASVARVEDVVGKAHGTAFVVAAGSLFPDTENPELLVLVTNAHVVSAEGDGAMPPEDATFRFELGDTTVSYTVERVVAESPKHELDITVVQPHPAIDDVDPVPFAARLPRLDERVYIIGHPLGGDLSFSLYDNKLLNYIEPMLHYRTPTEGGSSGSPVFNKNWQLIALHHFGKTRTRVEGEEGWQDANEGIALKDIIERLKEA